MPGKKHSYNLALRLAPLIRNNLIKPEQLKDKSTVCVGPDDVLWDLPFQALQPKDDRYLLEDFAIYYAPSLGVLKEMFASENRSILCHPPCWLLVIHASQTKMPQM